MKKFELRASKKQLGYRYIELTRKNSKAAWTELAGNVQGIYQKMSKNDVF